MTNIPYYSEYGFISEVILKDINNEQGDWKAMRKAQKEQAEHIIHLLGHVHDGIRKAIEKRQYDSAMELLSQCQESAIELGETIEEIEGEGFVTVSFLENYCEIVYQVYILLNQTQGINATKVHKNLRKALILVENSVKNDIKVRTEAVFLPYKASMWDSLESVWKVADEDPECDAYVIPIPYYDKNPDGSFREMHYEGDQYPKYVPVTWYEDYDFGEHHPDMIFIHNPYDNYNYVTSVHPFFYSKNLKQFTEKLVYIPYFVLSEPDPENEESLKGMAHFCTLPGVIYADKVIVQSEAMRQAYIKVMTDFTAGKSIGKYAERKLESGNSDINNRKKANEVANQKYWEEKIVGSGSPKIDKVLKTKMEELVVPAEWQRIIEKPDGKRKKIVFYNTSVTALLKHGEKMLKKMRNVLLFFGMNCDKVALLWRPHPLIEATLKSMRPELWNEYMEIVENYCNEKWGIYDNTSELDRAIVLSDAYYGDESSVAQLYKKVGKPCMIQNVEILQLISNKVPLWFSDAYIDENIIWFSENDFNGLYAADIETGEIKRIAEFPGEERLLDLLYMGLQRVDSKLYFMPFSARKMAIYDMEKNNFEMVELPFPKKEQQLSDSKVSCSFVFDNKIFIFGDDLCVFEYDLKEEKIEYCEKISCAIKDKVPNNNSFSPWCVFEGQEVYLSINNSNMIIKVDLGTQHVNCFEIGEKENQYWGVAKKNEILWIGGKDIIISWNLKTKEKKEMQIDINDSCHFGLTTFGNDVLFAINNSILRINEHNKIENIITLNESNQPYTRGWNSIVFMKCNRNDFSDGYYLDSGNYILHNIKRTDYKKQFTISKAHLKKVIQQKGAFFCSNQSNIEGKTMLYEIETFLWNINKINYE